MARLLKILMNIIIYIFINDLKNGLLCTVIILLKIAWFKIFKQIVLSYVEK